MPNIKSAKKRMKTSVAARLRNRIRKSVIKTAEQKLDALIAAKDLEAAKAQLAVCFKTLDKATKTNVIHKNKADRKKSRLSARLSKAC